MFPYFLTVLFTMLLSILPIDLSKFSSYTSLKSCLCYLILLEWSWG
ncbi:hypothetical protein OnM2_c2009o41 [Erysiphe neolycopersici]|uniref:ATP synthase F0 subunit 8 n=1 Tax=Erysiphe neolycopersici TaxID=212602 RepID=A0A420I1X2_9PEZI|nr:hypothetical protein OnM2_c2009o41 [Erysiphe neolycopersici]